MHKAGRGKRGHDSRREKNFSHSRALMDTRRWEGGKEKDLNNKKGKGGRR